MVSDKQWTPCWNLSRYLTMLYPIPLQYPLNSSIISFLSVHTLYLWWASVLRWSSYANTILHCWLQYIAWNVHQMPYMANDCVGSFTLLCTVAQALLVYFLLLPSSVIALYQKHNIRLAGWLLGLRPALLSLIPFRVLNPSGPGVYMSPSLYSICAAMMYLCLCVYICVCMWVCACMYMCLCKCMGVCIMYVCMYCVCVYVLCMCVCIMYVCMYYVCVSM